MMMEREESAVGFEHECVTMIAVRLGERTINGDGFAAAFKGRLAFFNFHRHMAVDDQSTVAADAEFFEDLFAKPCFIDESKVRVLRFVMWRFVGNEVPFEGRDAVLSE